MTSEELAQAVWAGDTEEILGLLADKLEKLRKQAEVEVPNDTSGYDIICLSAIEHLRSAAFDVYALRWRSEV